MVVSGKEDPHRVWEGLGAGCGHLIVQGKGVLPILAGRLAPGFCKNKRMFEHKNTLCVCVIQSRCPRLLGADISYSLALHPGGAGDMVF